VSTDGEIIQRSVRDPDAFREIFERHAAILLAYARKRLGSTTGDEILAQTFLVAFERRSRFDPTYTSARPWLFGIATNIIRHHLRDEREHLAALGKVGLEVPTESAEDVARLDAERMRPQLVAALLTLSDEDRDTFLLVALGQLTYEETATALGIPVGTVRSRIHRSRARLREQVRPRTAIGDGTRGSMQGKPWMNPT
jgi:RNA polymerase sigma factor (sigma-70 family)